MAIGAKGIGIRGELEAAALIRRAGFYGVRRGQQYEGASDSADLVDDKGELDEHVHLEVKLVRGFMTKLMRRAYIKALGEATVFQTPVLVYRCPSRAGFNKAERKLSQRWLVTVDARYFFSLLRKVI